MASTAIRATVSAWTWLQEMTRTSQQPQQQQQVLRRFQPWLLHRRLLLDVQDASVKHSWQLQLQFGVFWIAQGGCESFHTKADARVIVVG